MRVNSRVTDCPGLEGDLSLVELTNQMTRHLESGQDFDLDAFVQPYPDHADELRKLYPTIRGMVALGKSSEGAADCIATAEEPITGVLGDYRIVREVGRGGMGVVYEAEQIALGRRVALKILPLAAVLDPRQVQRFKTEAKAAALLHHQNIVPIHGVGTDRGHPLLRDAIHSGSYIGRRHRRTTTSCPTAKRRAINRRKSRRCRPTHRRLSTGPTQQGLHRPAW